MDTGNPSDKIDFIAKQFLCNVPIKAIDWKNIIEDLNWKFQEELLSKTVNSDIVHKFPIHPNYQRSFLKFLIDSLDKRGLEICDDCYNALGKLVASTFEKQDYFKHYLISNSGRIVSLRESVNLISDGTTGLRTWQAAIALSEWILKNSEYFKEQNVLELGSGLGLTGIVLALECEVRKVYLTDCHEKVLEKLVENTQLNWQLNQPKNKNVKIEVVNLPWENYHENECLKFGKIDTVIAADIIYDDSLFDNLLYALHNLVKYNEVQKFIFCYTERNTETCKLFLSKLSDSLFVVEEMLVPKQDQFIWPDDTAVRMMSITKV